MSLETAQYCTPLRAADILALIVTPSATIKSPKSPKEQLREVMHLVRTGLPEPGTLEEQWKRTSEAIRELKRKIITNPNSLDEVDRLRLLTLEAEFQQYSGQFENAARILEPTWKRFKPQLDAWSLKNPLGPKNNRGLLRQRIWALMHYVFYADYLLAGHHQRALDRLTLLKKIILAELKTTDYEPFGTLAVCHYFIGRCHRVSREFHEAEENFVLAQRFLYDRAFRELNRKGISASDRKYEQAFKDVYTARILSGLAWVAMHRGQLLRAEQFLRTAKTLLLDTNQESIKCFVRLLLWTVIRRRTAYSDPDYEFALTKLNDLYKIYEEIMDVTQQRRCASELLRGYLDLIEFGGCDKSQRKEILAKATHWLQKTETPSAPASLQRQHLHRSRYELLNGDVEAAENELREAAAESGKSVRQRGIPIMEAAIYLHKKELEKAANTLTKELNQLSPFGTKIRIQNSLISDPLMEAQCYVFLAQINATQKDYATARHYLEKWRGLSQFVDNFYLHHLADQVVTTGTPYGLKFAFDIFAKDSDNVEHTLLSRIADFENWLWESVHLRYPGLEREKLAKIYGKSRSTVTRRIGSANRKNRRG